MVDRRMKDPAYLNRLLSLGLRLSFVRIDVGLKVVEPFFSVENKPFDPQLTIW